MDDRKLPRELSRNQSVLLFDTLQFANISMFLLLWNRVAEPGSLSSGAKMAMKIFVKRGFTIFALDASFLRVIANLQN